MYNTKTLDPVECVRQFYVVILCYEAPQCLGLPAVEPLLFILIRKVFDRH
jgi:hypothetical protein